MKSLAYTTALVALLATAGLANAQSSSNSAGGATTGNQPGTMSADCPAAGSVPADQLPEKCKTTGLQNGQTGAATDPAATGGQNQNNSASGTATQPADQNSASGSSTQPMDQNSASGSTSTQPADQNAATGQSTDQTTGSTSQTTSAVAADAKAALGTVNPASSFLASKLIGQKVYSAANENVGDINDLVVDKTNGAIVAIIGVGGFLGIGEKDVAVAMDSLTAAKQDDNNIRLTINSTREQLEAAPAFDRNQMSLNLGQ